MTNPHREPQRSAPKPRHPWSECAIHGKFDKPQSFYIDRFAGCPACLAEDHARRAEQQAEWDRRDKVRESGLIGRFVSATFETFHADTQAQKRVLATCKEFAGGPFDEWRTLQLHGPVGTGKSHLLAAVVNATCARLKTARILTARELVQRIRATWRSNAPTSEADVVNDLANCDLLALDEIGVGFGTEAELLHVLDVVDRRYQLQKPMAIATNLNGQQLREVLGDRILDRLAENTTVRVCNWPSYRRRGAA